MAVQAENGPRGNYVARRLKLLNDYSRELFPHTPPDVKPTKYNTMYKKDYKDYPADVFLEGLMPKGKQPERETIRDVLFGESPTSMFAKWRIPKRLSGEVEEARIGDHVGLVQPEKVPTPKILRQTTLPAIVPPTREEVKTFTPKSRVSPSEARLTNLRRAKTSLDSPAMSMDRRQSRAQWRARLPDVDPKLLDKVMRLQDKEQKSGAQQTVRGTVMPDARRTVERWLEGASEGERQVALQFFGSLAGGRLMGGDGQEQSDRLRDVVNALQQHGSRFVAEAGLSPRGGAYTGNGHLKYVNLLDDSTRRNRWMHTTWHHLPSYNTNNRVTNSSSHYIMPHKEQHRHFVIHPDWPPN